MRQQLGGWEGYQDIYSWGHPAMSSKFAQKTDMLSLQCTTLWQGTDLSLYPPEGCLPGHPVVSEQR